MGTRSTKKRVKPAKKDLRVLITGINNPVVSRLVELLDRDTTVENIVLCDVHRPTVPFERSRFFRLDLTMPDACEQLIDILKAERINTVVHGAFLANPARDPVWAHEFEAIGTEHVLDACASTSVDHLVLKSTTMVYGARSDNPAFLEEHHPLRGERASRWVRDKVEADQLFQRFATDHPSLNVTIARLGTVLAPSATHYLARYFSRPVVPVLAGYDPLFQFLHLQDAGEALARMVLHRSPGIYNVVAGDVLPLSSILRLGGRIPLPIPRFIAVPIARSLWRAQFVDVPSRFINYFRYSWVADGSRFEETFQYRPRRSSRAVVSAFFDHMDNSSYPPQTEQD